MAWHNLIKDNIYKGNERLKQVIRTRMGLSPAMVFALFTVVTTTAVASIVFLSSYISPPTHDDPDKQRGEWDPDDTGILPEAIMQVGEISEDELRMYDGSDPEKPLLMAIKGQIYDVTQSSMFYEPGGPYALFGGRDFSRALATMSLEPQDLTSDISGLGPFELETLQDWEGKFMRKYVKVGTIKKPVVVTEGAADVGPSTTGSAPDSHSDVTETVPKTESEA